MKRWNVIFSTMRLQMKQSFVRPMFRFCLIANPILNTVLLYEMYKTSGKENFIAYVVLGAGLMGLWSCICFSSAGDINRERYSGTLALIYAAPAKFVLIVFGKILGNTLLSLLTFVISIVTAAVLFRVPIMIANPGMFVVALIGTIVSFIVISTMIAFLLTLSRKTELYMNCIELPFILLCGFVFPIEILPEAVQHVSRALPPTYAVELLRDSVYGISDTKDFFVRLGIMTGLSILYVVVSILLYRCIDKQVRINGTLNVA